MVTNFCRKYFQNEEKVSIIQLSNTRQRRGKDLLDFVQRFRDHALDSYDENDEAALVDIYINNIILEPARPPPSKKQSAPSSKALLPPLPYSNKELHVVLEQLLCDEVILPFMPRKPPSEFDKKHLRNKELPCKCRPLRELESEEELQLALNNIVRKVHEPPAGPSVDMLRWELATKEGRLVAK
ncbi:hypothetical protein L484_012813 [Morus notabilis]|uniref:Retrotransposon gag domain-containing protein n=1 Tax=Morus notabilis TaxID=981085 RepID=W9RFT9_9ROSA|nr:hypothetical protein L484_012813 [Morus notabilis]